MFVPMQSKQQDVRRVETEAHGDGLSRQRTVTAIKRRNSEQKSTTYIHNTFLIENKMLVLFLKVCG